MSPTCSSVVSANVCTNYFSFNYMPIFINHSFIKIFFVDVWLQISKGVISIYRSGLKNAAALSVNSCCPLLCGPSVLKQCIFSSPDPSIGNETAQARLQNSHSFGRLSQTDKILSTQLLCFCHPAGTPFKRRGPD